MNRSSHWRRCSTKIDILQNSRSSEYQAVVWSNSLKNTSEEVWRTMRKEGRTMRKKELCVIFMWRTLVCSGYDKLSQTLFLFYLTTI